jgi:uroporphyrinogen decarboxylase
MSNENTPAQPSRFLRALSGETVSPPPIWLMRQAGRYLPEYREVRAQAGGFLDLCYTPELAARVTLQPIERYGFDAAILFSDILIVAHALGQKVWFEEGKGPQLEPITTEAELSRLSMDRVDETVAPIYETVSRVSQALDDERALIGFCGGPWTVATYMVAGQSTPDQAPARLWAYRDPDGFAKLMDMIVEASATYLSGQVKAGAQALQIFESWAGTLPDSEFRRWVIAPTQKLVAALRAEHPETPIIGFPRASGPMYLDFLEATGVNALGCDTALSLDWIKTNLQRHTVVQGNLDPLLLVAGGAELERRTREIRDTLSGGPHIFNLGHGIVPQTPPEHVQTLVKTVRESF